MRIKINHKGKKIGIDVKNTNLWTRGLGLMFRTQKTNNLLFDFSEDKNLSLTGLFVFFDFLILWLDKDNNVLEWRIGKPFEFSIKTKKKFRRIVEIPVDVKNMKIIEFFVGKRKV